MSDLFNSPIKEGEHRLPVYELISKHTAAISSPRILALTSPAAYDIPTAVRAGIKESSLILCNNSKIEETCTSALKMESLDLLAALNILHSRGVQLDAANLDFCNNITNKHLDYLAKVGKVPVWKQGSLVSITLACNREYCCAAVDLLNEKIYGRAAVSYLSSNTLKYIRKDTKLAIALESFFKHRTDSYQRVANKWGNSSHFYGNGRSPMGWAAFVILKSDPSFMHKRYRKLIRAAIEDIRSGSDKLSLASELCLPMPTSSATYKKILL